MGGFCQAKKNSGNVKNQSSPTVSPKGLRGMPLCVCFCLILIVRHRADSRLCLASRPPIHKNAPTYDCPSIAQRTQMCKIQSYSAGFAKHYSAAVYSRPMISKCFCACLPRRTNNYSTCFETTPLFLSPAHISVAQKWCSFR